MELCREGHRRAAGMGSAVCRPEAEYPDLASEFASAEATANFPLTFGEKADAYIQQCQDSMEKVASQKASQVANAFGPLLPELIGGSADGWFKPNYLVTGSKPITADDAQGNYIYYGVRKG